MAKVIVIGSYGISLLRFRGTLLQTLAARGHDVTACAPDGTAEITAVLKKINVNFHSLPLARTGLNPLQDMQTFRHLLDFFRSHNPDAMLAYTIKPVIYASMAARFTGVKTKAAMITGLGYAFTGNTLKRRAIGHVAKRLYREALAKEDVVFFQNPDDRTVFEKSRLLQPRTRRVLINGSGIDLEEYPQKPLPKTLHCLLIARLLVDKGVREYADAAKRLKARRPEAVFSLVGGPDENPSAISQEELKEWIDSGVINYHGAVEDVRPYLTECSIFVLPSYYPEGTPRTILEAMATGRPIVTADSPGCRETVQHGENGFLVPPKDSSALETALEELFDNHELRERMGAASRRFAEQRYDVHKVNEAIISAMAL